MMESEDSHQSPFLSPTPPHTQSKDLIKESKGLSWNSGRALFDISSFRKWTEDGTPRAKPHNFNIRILINRIPEDINSFRRHFQYHTKVFHPKAQVWKSKLQSCPEAPKLVFNIYSAHTLQVHHLIINVVKDIERENGSTIETVIK